MEIEVAAAGCKFGTVCKLVNRFELRDCCILFQLSPTSKKQQRVLIEEKHLD